MKQTPSLKDAKQALNSFKVQNMFEVGPFSVLLYDSKKKRWVIAVYLNKLKRCNINTFETIYIPFQFEGVPVVVVIVYV